MKVKKLQEEVNYPEWGMYPSNGSYNGERLDIYLVWNEFVRQVSVWGDWENPDS